MRSMKEWLDGVRHRKYVGVAELAEQAAKILSVGGYVQERGTVTELPDERTVRYYLSEGLISPAEDKQGTASVFGYRHLLQLLVVKKLQSERLPIRTIRELVGSRGERQLERLLLSGEGERKTGSGEKNEALRYLETLLRKPASAPPASSPAPPASPARSQRSTGSLPASISSELSAPDAQHSLPQAERDSWRRVEIEPGLELHIRASYRVPRETKGLRRLVQSILERIALHGGRPGKGES